MATTVLPADALIDAMVPRSGGAWVTIAVPAVQSGDVFVYPRPRLVDSNAGTVAEVVLDMRGWLLSLPDRGTVPVECATIQAAVQVAERLRADAERGVVNYTPPALSNWARWWTSQHPDAALLWIGGDR